MRHSNLHCPTRGGGTSSGSIGGGRGTVGNISSASSGTCGGISSGSSGGGGASGLSGSSHSMGGAVFVVGGKVNRPGSGVYGGGGDKS